VRRTRRPLLSVVVPLHDVEPYLPACLESLTRQGVDSKEVVLVDDGSTDGSARVAADYVRRHRGARLIRQANAGLGAARNAGIAATRGRYLTFLDSDDDLPANAYRPMLESLERTGSDFATGLLLRSDPRGRLRAPARQRRLHAEPRVGTTLTETPEALLDVFACTKVFRRDFWDRAGLAFPVGIRYEDQPTTTAAYTRATSFDVLPDVVYHWRRRESGTSITQQPRDLAHLADRITSKRMADALLHDAPAHVRRVWCRDVLPVDMWEYFTAVPGASDEYWTTVRAALNEFWGKGRPVPFEHTTVPLQHRLMGWLVGQDRREELETLLARLEDQDASPVEIPGLPGFLQPGEEQERRWVAARTP
jgi:glycosyltransferase involved in cell wall biosynthesis